MSVRIITRLDLRRSSEWSNYMKLNAAMFKHSERLSKQFDTVKATNRHTWNTSKQKPCLVKIHQQLTVLFLSNHCTI